MITTELDRYEYTGSANPVVFRSGGTDIPIQNTAHVKVHVTTTGNFTAAFGTSTVNLLHTGHGHLNDQTITLSSATSLPTGLLANTVYYVVNKDTNTFQVSLSLDGSAVAFSSNGSGTLTWTKTLLKVISTDYTVALVGTTATVTWETGKIPGASDKVLFIRDVTFEQVTDLQNNSQFEAESVESQLDLMVNMAQQLKNNSDRQLKFSSVLISSDATEESATLTATATGRANKSLKFDASGNLGVTTLNVDNAEDYVLEAKSWSIEDGIVQKYNGTVASNVSPSEYSSKEYAQGDAPGGSSKEWAQTVDVAIDTTFSAKEYAQGDGNSDALTTGGSAKGWAQDTAKVNGATTNDRSAKAWSQGASMTGSTLGGSSKDWAQKTDGAVNTTFSAKEYAQGTQASTGGSAKDYATKVDGGVSGATSDHSSKAWSVGGTGVTGVSTKGASKDWAIGGGGTMATTADGAEFSAKEYSQGVTATGGTSKQWSLGGGSHAIGTAVAGTDYSAKAYSQSTTAGTSTYGGSAKGWASTAYDTAVPGAGSSDRSALHYSTAASNSATSAKASAAAVASVFDSFDDTYLGKMADGATATDADTTGTWAINSNVITVASATNIVVGQEVTGAGIPTDANVIVVAGTSITISENMTAAGSGVDLDFRGQGVYGAFNVTKDGPATDNDGGALANGMLYFNTTDNSMKVYKETGAAWIKTSASGGVSLVMHKYVYASGTATSALAAQFTPTLTYEVNNIVVWLNGVKLDATDYVATNGNDITNLAALAVNDELVVLAFKTFEVGDAVSATSGGTFGGAVTFSAGLTGALTGNASGTSATVTTAAQPAITSVGTLTAVTVTGAITANGGLETDTNSIIKDKGRFMQHSNNISWVMGG